MYTYERCRVQADLWWWRWCAVLLQAAAVAAGLVVTAPAHTVARPHYVPCSTSCQSHILVTIFGHFFYYYYSVILDMRSFGSRKDHFASQKSKYHSSWLDEKWNSDCFPKHSSMGTAIKKKTKKQKHAKRDHYLITIQ